MTFDQFVDVVINYATDHPEQRVGQACMNAMRWIKPYLWGITPDVWEIDDWEHPEIKYWFEAVHREW